MYDWVSGISLIQTRLLLCPFFFRMVNSSSEILAPKTDKAAIHSDTKRNQQKPCAVIHGPITGDFFPRLTSLMCFDMPATIVVVAHASNPRKCSYRLFFRVATLANAPRSPWKYTQSNIESNKPSQTSAHLHTHELNGYLGSHRSATTDYSIVSPSFFGKNRCLAAETRYVRPIAIRQS